LLYPSTAEEIAAKAEPSAQVLSTLGFGDDGGLEAAPRNASPYQERLVELIRNRAAAQG
jgi:hypothetical protein